MERTLYQFCGVSSFATTCEATLFILATVLTPLTARAQTVTGTIATGPNPFAMAVNTVTNTIYITNSSGVTAVDEATNAATAIPFGPSPGPIAVNTATNKIYVGTGNNSVTVLDGLTHASSTVNVGGNPESIAVNSATNKVYVATSSFDGSDDYSSVVVIDGATNATTTITEGIVYGPVAVNPLSNTVYVCGNILGGEATVIIGATNVSSSVGANTSPGSNGSALGGQIAYSPDAIVVNTQTNEVYIGNQNPSDVALIDGSTNAVTDVGVSEGVVAMALNMVTNKIYCTTQGTTGVMVIDGATNAAILVESGSNSEGIAVNPVTDKVYVANCNASGSVTVIDGTTNNTLTLVVGAFPFALAVNPVTDVIYVLGNDANGSLTVIDGTAASIAPAFAIQPVSHTVNAGASFAFDTQATGMPAPTYQWALNGTPLADGNGISGSTGPVLYVNGGISTVAGDYTCTATNSAGSASSSRSLTVVNASAPGRMIDISSRAYAGTLPANLLIAGFVVRGETANTLILRGVGPSLADFGISDFAATPTLSLFDSASPPNLITRDSGWQASPLAPTPPWTGNVAPFDASGADFAQVGAFALTPDSGDSAVKVALPAGAYTSQVAGTNTSGVALAEVYLVDAGDSSEQLINISSRAYVVGGDNILIAGFVISGSTSETVLIRASGPALTAFGVPSTLPDPELQLFDGQQNLIASDAGWAGSPQVSRAASVVGAFTWSNPSSADSAILITLPPGSYTAQVSSLTGLQGAALVEVYAVP
jgi:DNA-binding beta-propeller fold protein YncE